MKNYYCWSWIFIFFFLHLEKFTVFALKKQKYDPNDLIYRVFESKISNDIYMDPCKAENFLGDIALLDDKFNKKLTKDEAAITQHKQEVLEGLQIEEEGLLDYVRTKTKHQSPSELKNDPLDGLVSSSSLTMNNNLTLKNSHWLKRTEMLHKRRKRHHHYHKKKKNDAKIRRNKRAATARQERIWDYGVIPYEIDANFSGLHRSLFKQAMKHWENLTCVKFVEREMNEHQNFIVFTERPCGCCSFVGKRGNGGQAISIGRNCDKFGIVVHELGHVVGFWHEHTRPDRDNHVNIIRENIMTGQEYNFNKLNEEEVNSLGLTYDYDSIMHYARNTFSKGTYLDTIMPIDVPGRRRPEIGQRVRLSEGDISQTNLLYKCPKCGRTFQSSSASFAPPPHSLEPFKCEWRIQATHGEKIHLNFTENRMNHHSVDCRDEYVEIRDGYWHRSPLLGRFCGRHQIQPITSSGSRLLVYYVTSLTVNSQINVGSLTSSFQATYDVLCGGDIELINSSDVAILESPNYPDEYQPNKECIWRIRVRDQGHQVALTFHSFDIENHDGCVYDYVEIRDGGEVNSPLIKVHCGQKLPTDITSSKNQLIVKFVSDSSVQKSGFSARIRPEIDECAGKSHGCHQLCINTIGHYSCGCRPGFELHSDGKHCEDACGGVLTMSNGTVTSPSFPDFYPVNKDCVWEIQAQNRDIRITLNFTHFDLEGSTNQQQNCEYDRVEIYSKFSTNGNLKKHGIYCGQQAPPLMLTSETDILRIIFHSDTSVQKSGFAAVFYTDVDECASFQQHDGNNCQHECINTLGSFLCQCHNEYFLDENGHDCIEGGCKYEIDNVSGTITSPNYPDLYPPKKDCVWHFTTTPGHRPRINFNSFDLEPNPQCEYDHVNFFDGSTMESPSLGRYCGQKRPPVIVGNRNRLLMTLKTDGNIQKTGFQATYSTVCGGRLDIVANQKRHLYSHARFGTSSRINGSDDGAGGVAYENLSDCDWTIVAPQGFNVKLSFLTFDLEDERDCGYDYVEIFSGMDETGPSYGRHCGAKIPPEIISTNDALLVRFRADNTLVAKGFSLVYEAVTSYNSEEEDNEDIV